MKKTKLEIINTNLRKYTFQNKKIREWVENNSKGRVLNLFAGPTKLKLKEVRVDLDQNMNPHYCIDAYDFVRRCKTTFDTILLDPPYSYRKSMEFYKGNYTSRFKLIADGIPRILNPKGIVISFGYHSTFMGKKRDFRLKKMCIFAHGGAQHCTIAIVEKMK
jgi:hypothetical protein